MNDEFATELVAICRFFGLFEREAVCCGTVTVQQCVVMQELLAASRDISGLASYAGVSASAMTRLVDGLERRGWVIRSRGEDDRRRVDVGLTQQGRREAERLREMTEDAVAALLSRIPAAKHPQVVESLRLIRMALTDTRQGLESCCGPASR